MPLNTIPYDDFSNFISEGFQKKYSDGKEIASKILEITQCHPYYTQQLAYTLWNNWNSSIAIDDLIKNTIDYLLQIHDVDYQRLWQGMNQTDKKILLSIAKEQENLLAQDVLQKIGISASSTIYSGLKRLVEQGFILKQDNFYTLDDPFFKNWILKKRNQ